MPMAALEGVSVYLTPDLGRRNGENEGAALEGASIIVVPLRADLASEKTPAKKALETPFRRRARMASALVTLRWRNDFPAERRRPRIIRLSATPERAADWNDDWLQWSWARRVATGERADAALTAQDSMSGDGRTLTLLLLPEDETREAYLEFDAPMVEGVTAGDRPFALIAADAEAPEQRDTAEAILRLTHPEARYLQYLPSVWREAMEQATLYDSPRRGFGAFAPYQEPPFFTRYLRGFEDMNEPLMTALSGLSSLFAVETAPADFLPWLASWLGAVLDDSWSPMRRRQLIREAIPLFRRRGTLTGLRRFLEIYAGVTPDIADQPFTGMRLSADAKLGADLTRLGNIAPHSFVVTLALKNAAEVNIETVRAIIESQRPAHTTYDLRVLSAGS